MSAVLHLVSGEPVLIDEEFYDSLSQFSWWAHRSGRSLVYARRFRRTGEAGRKSISIHRVVLGVLETPEILVDHINGNTLDNRRANLRPATPAQNQANRTGPTRALSGFRGVSQTGSRWSARFKTSRKITHLGTFDTAVEAAIARDRAAFEALGQFATLNFPEMFV